MSSENPSINGISHDETCYTASILTNVTDFLTFIESQASSCFVLLSIAQSHNITVLSKPVLEVIRNLISEHISSGACLGSSSPSCTILNSSFCGEEPDSDDNNADLRLIH